MNLKFIKLITLTLTSLFVLGCIESGPPLSANKGTKFAGTRQSYYGIKPFPSKVDWGKIQKNVSNKFPGYISGIDTVAAATPVAIWIVGGIQGTGDCALEFPSPDTDRTYENITFYDSDKHEPYLTYFDEIGVKVFLQVEAGMADMDTLIDLVLTQYGHHKSVIGFGIDIEWFPSPFYSKTDSTLVGPLDPDAEGEVTNSRVAVTKEQAERFDAHVKSYNPSYRIFLKHWLPNMAPANISDVIYVNDGQGVGSLTELIENEFKPWADKFKNSDVGFQYGYGSDRSWWSQLDDPMKEIGDKIDEMVGKKQLAHLFWVDFTLDDTLMSDLWE